MLAFCPGKPHFAWSAQANSAIYIISSYGIVRARKMSFLIQKSKFLFRNADKFCSFLTWVKLTV